VDEGRASPGCLSPPGRLYDPKDAADLLPLQAPAPGRFLSGSRPGSPQIPLGSTRHREGGVWLIFAFFSISAACEAFSPTNKGLPIALDIHFVTIYLSYRWLNGKMAIRMHSQLLQQKTKFLSFRLTIDDALIYHPLLKF